MLKFVYMILKLNSPTLKLLKLILLLPIKKLLLNHPVCNVLLNPLTNITDFMLPLNLYKKNFVMILKPENVVPKLTKKKDPELYKINMVGKKITP